MMWVFPAMPENMWGGLVGLWMGTRTNTSTERLYQGGSDLVDFLGMSWRRTQDLHDNSSWRQQVHDFLIGEDSTPAGLARQQAPGYRSAMGARPEYEVLDETGDGRVVPLAANGEARRMRTIGAARVLYVDRAFSREEDRCVQSSYDDYKQNECWICRSGNIEWDMWQSCHHLFCASCSTERLKRRMPCPLCRVASTTVLRGKAATEQSTVSLVSLADSLASSTAS
jgi:hypothetical protein